jgi:hypothetical protein
MPIATVRVAPSRRIRTGIEIISGRTTPQASKAENGNRKSSAVGFAVRSLAVTQRIEATTTRIRPVYFGCVSDYEWLVELAAKGLAERDNHPMPKSVTTPDAFYEVMARAAHDAIGLPALLERVARAEQNIEITQEALSHADTKAEKARHGRST